MQYTWVTSLWRKDMYCTCAYIYILQKHFQLLFKYIFIKMHKGQRLGEDTSWPISPGRLFLFFWVQTYRWDFQKTPIHIFNIFENHTHWYISIENPDPIIYFITILWPVNIHISISLEVLVVPWIIGSKMANKIFYSILYSCCLNKVRGWIPTINLPPIIDTYLPI
jgi:hypothetical protein